ncbi:transporter substrate-binding domain-containing protein [Chelatococcus asaccharovorans]|uniref:Amino acid ABC transporter substrate-binding protein (PAAT family) n=1 Tax=Chelatococcus asaccharovorans TaxID=28210 RepID=A0A2V3UUR2_9HYPH|nr:transporter substrate-binding domain-containing protein [Chelatococcus asaccharovorans]MBS7701824.1 transporter substrate-binding domain-containing protein [Chelatococcus asaccharovorans]PXW64468.1 amino acid ABC transporter substrate-binding protein (PAAT family) [Chelatococcus asaccharovorans]CAH1665735.1 Amino acid ABC transporter substrate-binding protein (PAAT family) [Chelatococcus asaccharovorans]CAH1681810.1 Amino acid ABC transporter substrate-binding protein (PAAT family) [Chelatoc
MTKTSLFCLVICAAGTMTGAAWGQQIAVPASLKEKGELRIGVKCDSPPSGFLDEKGNPAGIDVDIGRHIANRAFGDPNKAVFTCVTAATRVQMLASGKVDVLFATMGVTEERKQTVDFATSTNWGGSGILVRAGEEIQSLDQLKGKTLLTNKGAWQIGFLEKNYPEIKLIKYDNITDAIQSLRQGRGDGVTQDGHLLVVAASKDPRLKVTDVAFQIGWSAPAVRRGDTALREFISAMVSESKKDGTYRAAVERYAGAVELEERIQSYTTLPPDGSSDQNSVLPLP